MTAAEGEGASAVEPTAAEAVTAAEAAAATDEEQAVVVHGAVLQAGSGDSRCLGRRREGDRAGTREETRGDESKSAHGSLRS
jgi:hypothetical protein